MDTADNPRAVIGSNEPPDWAKATVDRLAMEYAETAAQVETGLTEAELNAPAVVNGPEDLSRINTWVVQLRDLRTTVLAYHKREKVRPLREGEGVDQFFFDLRDRIDAVGKAIGQRGVEYNQRRLAEERERREREARERADQAKREADAAAKAKREAEEAEAAARRARNPERKAELAQQAEQARSQAALAQVDAMVARDALTDAQVAAAAPVADILRTRHGDTGHMSTGKMKPYVEIVDAGKLDLDKLRPYLPQEALLKALKAWARITEHKQPMAGAIIEMRADTVYRG